MTGEEVLFGRISDMLSRARDGVPAAGDFLDPAQQRDVSYYLRSVSAPANSYMLWGGYDDAERRMLFVLPDYMTGDGELNGSELGEYASEFVCSELKAVMIAGSGYERLDHRSFLGALLALGIDRSRLGDIIVRDGRDACLFCRESIAEFLLSGECPLLTVGRDHVRVSLCENPGDFVSAREFDSVSDTVASKRLDCVVAALCGLSRDKTDSMIKAGLVARNYTVSDSRSDEVSEKDIISVRGYGKYIIEAVGTPTKKGRLRLTAKKYK